MTELSSPDSKVLFRVPADDGSAQVETLWATSLGNDQYRLENSPFYAYSVSWKDVVFAPFDPAKTVRRYGKSSRSRGTEP